MKSITLKLFMLAVLLNSPACSKSSKPVKPPDIDYYTCTMHPSVHAEAPGKCPICGMELVPVKKGTSAPEKTTGSREFVVPVERQQQIGVTYATVERKPLEKQVRAVGTVEPDLQ